MASNVTEAFLAIYNQVGAGNGRSMSGETHQTAVIYDALSEGEIEGLVDGSASIYLNGSRLVDLDTYKTLNEIKTTATVSAGSTTVTVATGALDFADVEGGQRKILIKGAGKQGSSIFSATAGTTTLTASTSWFTGSMATGGMMTEGGGRIEIAGAGQDGRPYVGYITSHTSATSVQVYPEISTTVSGVSGGIDLVSVIASYDVANNQVTTTTAATTSVSGVAATLSPPVRSATTYTTETPKTNWEGINYAFRTGTKHQNPMQVKAGGNPTASFVHAPQIRMDQNNTFDGTNGVGNHVVTATQVGVPNAAETDQIKFVIECPQLFAISTKSGTEYNSWVEFTCDFKYYRGSDAHTVRIVGPSDSAILGRAGGFEYFNDQSSASLHDGFIVNQTKKKFQEEYVHNIEQYKPFDNWELIFQRVNEPNKAQGHHDNMNEAFIKFVEAQLTDKFRYPHTAYAGISFSAKDFSGQPKRGYHIRGKKIQVPTNYLTREEMGANAPSYKRHISNGTTQGAYQDWDGNFRGDASSFAVGTTNHDKVYCNNPAWVFYDIVRDKRYGLGDLVDEDFVDKYALYQIARYCDELVSDGKGGFEPRFTCNAYFNKRTEAYKVLKDLATVFRGICYWMDGQLVPVQDRPKEPVYTFTSGNVIGGEFAYESTSERIRKNQVIVKWNDPQDQYKSKSHSVDDVDNIIDTGKINSTNVTAFGCTSEGQAHRIGKWRLITDKIETELCKFTTSVNAAFIRPGDIINIQDYTLDAVQFSGRINTGTSTTAVTLDRSIVLAANTTYKLHLVYPSGGAYLQEELATINGTAYVRGDLILLDEDGAAIDTEAKASNLKDDSNNPLLTSWNDNTRVETKTISTGASTTSTIAVSSAFSSVPNSDVIWAISGTKNNEEVSGTPKQYRVMGISEDGDGQYTVGAALYNDKKYDIIEKDYKILPDTKSEHIVQTNKLGEITDFVPAPDEATFTIQQVSGGSDTDGTNQAENMTGTLEGLIEWANPVHTTISSKVIASSYVNETLGIDETGITLGAAATTDTGFGIIERGTSNEEIIQWTAKSGSDITAVRGVLGSKAIAHDSGVSFTEMQSYESPYTELSHFEVEHTLIGTSRSEKFTREIVSGGRTFLRVKDPIGGTHNIRVRTVSNAGTVSKWTVFTNTIRAPGTVKATSKGNLAVGGTMSSPIAITTAGAYNIANSLYSFTDATGEEYSISQSTSTHAQRTQSFSGLSASNGVGYALFDTSAAASDPWKAIDQKTDSTYHVGYGSTTSGFTWWKEVGAGNNGLTLCNGTITATAGSSTVTGSSTAFTTDFAAGDVIRLGSTNDYAENTAAWYGYVDKVTSNTSLTVRGSVTKAFSSKFAYKQSFKPDFSSDTILSKVTRTASSAYSLEHYGSVPGADGEDGATGATGAAGTDAYTVRLSASKYAIPYDIDGDESTSITFTAVPQGIQGTATYEFKVDGVTKQSASTTATYTMADSDEPASGAAKVVKVTMFDDATEKATDSVSVYGIQDGQDAVTIILTNEAHALPTTSGGTVTYTNSGTDIRVFKGSTALAYGTGNNQFTVSASASNITAGAASTVSTYTRRFADASSCTAQAASITFTIAVKNSLGTSTSFTKVQTLNKTTDGADGAAGVNTAIVALYRKHSSGTGSGPTSFSGTFTYTFATAALSGGTLNSWTTSPPGITNGEYIWVRQATASGTGSTDTIPTSEFSTSVVHSGVGEDGSSVTGAAGNANAVVSLYQTSSSNSTAPNDPTGTMTYTFSTNALSGGNLNSWSQSIPTVGTNKYLWVIQATASSSSGTDTIAASEWSAAVVVSAAIKGDQGNQGNPGDQGDPGAQGISGSGNRAAYYAASFAGRPTAAPTANGLNAPTGWSFSEPSLSSGQLMWVSYGNVAAGGTAYTWTTPQVNIKLPQSILDLGFGAGTIGLGNVDNVSQAQIRNGITTYVIDLSPTLIWEGLGGNTNITGLANPSDWTISWFTGGSADGTTVIRAGISVSGTSLTVDTHTQQSNSASATVSLNATSLSSLRKTTVTKGGITVTLTSRSVNGIEWSFNKG